MSKVAAVVVTFNRLGELKKNIEMLRRQSRTLDAIYVVDNASTDGTDFYLTELAKEQAQVIPCRLERNVGGAGGFSYGLERAALDGFNWIWLMDDDGRPLSEQTLEALLNVAEKESSIVTSFATVPLFLSISELRISP